MTRKETSNFIKVIIDLANYNKIPFDFDGETFTIRMPKFGITGREIK